MQAASAPGLQADFNNDGAADLAIGVPFEWANGQMRDFGLAAFGTANDLNDRGQITGGVPLTDAFHAYRLQHGRLVDLDSADVPYSEGVAINEDGQVAGNSAPSPAAFNQAFLWSRASAPTLAPSAASSARRRASTTAARSSARPPPPTAPGAAGSGTTAS
jgi:uncharacterized membrane protein